MPGGSNEGRRTLLLYTPKPVLESAVGSEQGSHKPPGIDPAVMASIEVNSSLPFDDAVCARGAHEEGIAVEVYPAEASGNSWVGGR